MKKTKIIGFIMLISLALTSTAFAVTVTNTQQVRDFVNNIIFSNPAPFPGTSTDLNGYSIQYWSSSSNPGTIDVRYYNDPANPGAYLSIKGSADQIFTGLAQALGFPLTTVANIANQNSPSQLVTNQVWDNLVMPTPKTENQKRYEKAKRTDGKLRSFSSNIRFKYIEDHSDHGTISGLNIGLAYDKENVTYGVIIPYDYLNYSSLEGNRIGTIFFVQNRLINTDKTTLSLTGNLNYIYSSINMMGAGTYGVNMFGAGLSLGGSHSFGAIEVGAGASLQANVDDSSLSDNHQFMYKTGLSIGYNLTPNQIVSMNGAYVADVTTYNVSPLDRNFFEVGAEYRYVLSDSWHINVGYKKTLDMLHYKSDLVYIGTVMHF